MKKHTLNPFYDEMVRVGDAGMGVSACAGACDDAGACAGSCDGACYDVGACDDAGAVASDGEGAGGS